MFKIILLIVVIIGCTYIGWGLSNYYTIRHAFYKDFLNFLEFCEIEITFYHNKMQSIFDSYIETSPSSKEFIKFLNKTKLQFENDNIKVDNLLLSSNEQKLLANFFNGLGTTNAEKQGDLIEYNKSQFQIISNECAGKAQKFAPLCTRLGFLFGLAIAICLI